MTLQAALVLLFVFGAGFLFWSSGYVHSTINNQLAAQQITFPKANDPGVTPAALTPCGALPNTATCPIATSHAVGVANSNAMTQFAGQTLANGDQAKAYADSYIQVHLSDMGMTYSQASYQALLHPTNTKFSDLANTIFKGTTLRGMLLQAYGWWTVGNYAGYAAIGMVVAALASLGAFLFELFGVVRRTATKPAGRSVGRPVAQTVVA